MFVREMQTDLTYFLLFLYAHQWYALGSDWSGDGSYKTFHAVGWHSRGGDQAQVWAVVKFGFENE